MDRVKVRPVCIVHHQHVPVFPARRKEVAQGRGTREAVLVEIDQAHLAEEIASVKDAEQKELEKERAQKKDVGVFKAIGIIIRGKRDTGERFTTGFLALPLIMIFRMLAIAGGVVFLVGIFAWAWEIFRMKWVGGLICSNVIALLLIALILVMIFLYSLFALVASRELERTEDKDFVVNVFSGVVGLAALIVSLVALNTVGMH